MIQQARDSRPLPAHGASAGSIMTQRGGKAQAGALEGWGKGPTVVLGLKCVSVTSQRIIHFDVCDILHPVAFLRFFIFLFSFAIVCFWLPLCHCVFKSSGENVSQANVLSTMRLFGWLDGGRCLILD